MPKALTSLSDPLRELVSRVWGVLLTPVHLRKVAGYQAGTKTPPPPTSSLIMPPKKQQQKQRQNSSKLQMVKYRAPAAVSVSVKHTSPKFIDGKDGTRIAHSELLVPDLNSSVGFQGTSFALNPGLSSLAFLSPVANNYTKYRVKSMSFTYVPVETATDTKGRVYMGIDYDSEVPFNITKTYATNLDGTKSTQAYRDCTLHLNCKLAQAGVQWKRVRCGPRAGNPGMTDLGSLILSTDGFASVAEIGEVWVTYDIEFMGSQAVQGTNATPHNVSQTIMLTPTSSMPMDEEVPIFATAHGGSALMSADDMGFVFSAVDGSITVPCGVYHILLVGAVTSDSDNVLRATLAIQLNGVAQSYQPTIRATYENGDDIQLVLDTIISVPANTVIVPTIFCVASLSGTAQIGVDTRMTVTVL